MHLTRALAASVVLLLSGFSASADVELSVRFEDTPIGMAYAGTIPCSYAGSNLGRASRSWEAICTEPGYEPWQTAFLDKCPDAERPPFVSGGVDMRGWFDAVEKVKTAFPDTPFAVDFDVDGDFERHTKQVCDHAVRIGLLEQE